MKKKQDKKISLLFILHQREYLYPLTIIRNIDIAGIPRDLIEVLAWVNSPTEEIKNFLERYSDYFDNVIYSLKNYYKYPINYLIDLASAPIITYMDDDIWMPENWGKISLKWYDFNKDIKNFWGFTWRIRDIDRNKKPSIWNEKDKNFLLDYIKEGKWIVFPGDLKFSIKYPEGTLFYDYSSQTHKSSAIIVCYKGLVFPIAFKRRYYQDSIINFNITGRGYAYGIWVQENLPYHLGNYSPIPTNEEEINGY